SEYTVKPGDTACSVARANNISVAELAQANNMTKDQIARLSVNQLLKIPPATGHRDCSDRVPGGGWPTAPRHPAPPVNCSCRCCHGPYTIGVAPTGQRRGAWRRQHPQGGFLTR
ncbi:MAG TPA: LysM peptidoglycan-binding domain-containing protein, partial [Dehalococcoidia bacterium]